MAWVVGASPEIRSQSKWRDVMITMLVPTIVAIIAVGLRFWIRWRKLHSEDWVTLGTMLFGIAYTTSGVIQTRFGLGLPWALRPGEYTHEYLIANYAAWPAYLLGLAGFKVALCISYLRMTRGSLDTGYRQFIIGVAVCSSIAHIVFVFLFMFACTPISRTFDFTIAGTCLDFAAVNYALCAIVITFDVMIFLLPIPLVRRLRLDRATKTGLTLVFSLGLITTVLSSMRLQQIHRIVDGDGDTTKFTIRGSMELNVGIITSCLPFLRPVLGLLPKRLLAYFSSTSSKNTSKHPTRHLEPGFHPILTIGGSPASYPPYSSPTSSPNSTQNTTESRQGIGNHSAISSKFSRTSKRGGNSFLSSFQSRQRSPPPPPIGGGFTDGGRRLEQQEMSVMKTVHMEVDSVQAPPSPTLWLNNHHSAGRGVDAGEEFGRGKTRREIWEFEFPKGDDGG